MDRVAPAATLEHGIYPIVCSVGCRTASTPALRAAVRLPPVPGLPGGDCRACPCCLCMYSSDAKLLIQGVSAGPNGRSSAHITGSQLGKLFALHDRLVTIASEGKAPRTKKGEGGTAQVTICSQDLQQLHMYESNTGLRSSCLLAVTCWNRSICCTSH